MVSRFRKKVGKGDLKKRTEESYASKDDSGKFRNYIDPAIPLKQWKCEEGDHTIDIIPFLAGENNFNGLKKDTGTHKIEVYAHSNIGINENAYVCPQLTISKPCPICDARAAMKKRPDYDEDEFKALAPKRRVVYQVCVYDSSKTEAMGVMYWESSFHLSEKNILAIAKNNRTGGFIEFADPDTGKTIEFTREGKGVSTDYVGFKFLDREEPISDEILDQAVSLDEYVKILSYDELKEIFQGSDEEDEKPLKRRTKRKEEPEEEEEEETPKTKVRKKREPEPEPEEEIDDIPFDKDSDETEEETESDEPPQRRSRRNSSSEETLESRVKKRSAPKEEEEEAPRPTRLRRRR